MEGEVIISEFTNGDEPRTIWVYHPEDDFKITIPPNARMTFGYFNPASAGTRSAPRGYDQFGGHGAETMKTTCLRVYADTTDKRQIAAFLGVSGFRDMSQVSKTLMKRRVTIEINHEDDGLGNIDHARKQLAKGNVVDEDALF